MTSAYLIAIYGRRSLNVLPSSPPDRLKSFGSNANFLICATLLIARLLARLMA
jgi:hypothetical protein